METYMEEVMRESQKYSYWGHRILSGDVVVLKNLYGRIWEELPVLIRMLSQLQISLTSVEIENDKEGVYSPEFLYYWGMLCIGEQSRLIPKDLETAESCFEKICRMVSKAEARLAYVELLKSDEPAKGARNVERIDTLRRWAGRGDIFSSIVLAKIIFYQYLVDYNDNILELPTRVLRLLDYPCQKGHPVAIRFYNAVMECIGTPEAMERIEESNIWPDCLWDFEMDANMQIGTQP